MKNEPTITVTRELTRANILSLRQALAWADNRKRDCEVRMEDREQDCAVEAAKGLEEKIAAEIKLLRAQKDYHRYVHIKHALALLLGEYADDQLPLPFPEETQHGDAAGSTGADGEVEGGEGPVSGRRDVPEAGQGSEERPADGAAELAGDGAGSEVRPRQDSTAA